ncbi:hypothetical protein FSP39_021246 [Pinctada imbricata]|uniref:Glutathione S-transferase omega n=1 Tax=Pinctada imbricata TaxID=66713 RepID=A0AA89CBF0_PINIB|nr:hypothetical protein FSP39_021246 [Pinctada imbricata]
MTDSPLKLYSAWYCPFAQRAWIALLQKGLPFEYVEVNPYSKPLELLSVNPRGLVPAIVQGEKSVYESSVCIEFVDELSRGSCQLLPKDPWDRAQARILGDFITKKIVPNYYKMLQSQDVTGQDNAKMEMLENLKVLITLMSTDGPYMLGARFGYADIMLVPYTLRLPVMKFYRNFSVPETKEFERIHVWMRACHAQSSVQQTIPNESQLITEYERYANNSTNSQVANAIRKGEGLP